MDQEPEREISPDELLRDVKDRKTFIRFVKALAAESERVKEIERANPAPGHGTVLGWQNGDIPSFLDAAVACFEGRTVDQPEAEPSWKMLAEFLYFGKIYE